MSLAGRRIPDELASEWHPTKNDRGASDVTAGSSRRVWWRCDHGHEWQASVAKRVGGQGCPICSGRRVLRGFNDLATIHPQLASEWHDELNHIRPEEVTAGSNRQVWWRCTRQHTWEAAVANRTKLGRGCPFCKGQRPVVGETDLVSTHPELATWWHPTRNTEEASSVTAGSNRVVWWRCSTNHEWQAPVKKLTSGQRCPFCSGHRVLAGFNDLSTLHPSVAAEWHPTRNELGPESFTAGSQRYAWWLCLQGHKFRTTIHRRVQGGGCPICSGRLCVTGTNDLLTVSPEIASEWHPSRNVKNPSQVTAGSQFRAWWLCDQGHAWRTSVANRSAGRGCPSCADHGFKPDSPAVLYLLTHRRHEAYKIGITNAGGARLQLFHADGWKEEATFSFDRGKDASDVERSVLRWVRDDLRLPPYMTAESMRTGGHTETFAASGLPAEMIIQLIRSEIARLRT